jgi:N-acetylmuramoyl-L-alanine amidase
LSGKIITVDPGHNGGNAAAPDVINQIIWNGREDETCDTTGTETDSGYTEALFNFNVATYLTADLRAEGATVVLTRTSNAGVGPCVNERAAIGNNAHSDAAISIHADGGPPQGRGFAVLEPVSDGINAGIIGPSQVLGADIRNAFLAGRTEPVSSYDGIDGIQPRDDLGGLNLSTVPKVLVECGNMRNSTDAALLTTPQWQQAVAEALAAGLTDFLNGMLPPRSVAYNSNGVENVFWRSTNGQLVHDYFTGGPWLGPQPLGGSLGSNPAAITTRGSGLDVFYVGSNGGLFHSYFTGGAWVENNRLPGSNVAGGLTATYNSNGVENVFWRSTNGQLVHDYFTGSGAWVPGSIPGSGGLRSDPAALATSARGLDVFYQGNTGGPWHSYFDSPPGTWVTQPLAGPAVSGLVAAALTQNGGEDAFFSTKSGGLDHDYYTGSGPWIGPASLPS